MNDFMNHVGEDDGAPSGFTKLKWLCRTSNWTNDTLSKKQQLLWSVDVYVCTIRGRFVPWLTYVNMLRL